MSKSAAILGLVALASAGAPPAYGPPAYGVSSSADPVYSSDPASSWGPVSSSAPVYGSSSYPASSEPVAYPSASSSWVVSAYPSSSSVVYYSSSSSVVPSATPTPACWSECFAEAGITSEADLCGNVEVDKCIHDTCCQEESWAYWQWYDSYCPAPSSSVVPSSTVPVGPYSSSVPASTPSSPVDSCWAACFAKYDVTSEAALCGNDEVSACIHDTCCAAEDKAYWVWYDGYCVAASTTTYTTVIVVTPTEPASAPYTATYPVTSAYSWSPVESSPASGLPAPPPAPPGPYSSYPAPGSSAAPVATGAATTGYAAPSASQWAPVPATGAGAVTKPGVLFGAVLAVAALF